MDFGNTLRCLIEDAGKTQKQVAKDLSIAPTTLGNYIRGLREPDFSTLVSIADYFGVSTDFLLAHEVAPRTTQEGERLLLLFDSLSQKDRDRLLSIAKVLK
ncbi:MAG: helix-turn-helix transcriptional regulator [Clostridia bacterium]|nr:helix-turn-helix transcriptional regulator [Clostridia bacterium]